MLRRTLGFALMLSGLLALSALLVPAATPAYAGPALQPSPRPTIVPTSQSRGDDYDYADPPEMGRVTGTVIDLRTGAPMAGRVVRVGTLELVTDANGNYDTWVPAGDYPVALPVGAEEGTAAQDVTMAKVWGEDVVVVHLFYTSLAPAAEATATVAPTIPPMLAPTLAPTIVPTIAPAPADEPVALPAELPVTAVDEEPASLPVTGDEMIDPRAVALGGAALLAVGAALMLMPHKTPARAMAVATARRRRQRAEELLAELLRRDV